MYLFYVQWTYRNEILHIAFNLNFVPNTILTVISTIFIVFSWYDREHIPINLAFDNQIFNQIIFASEELTATTTTYAVAPWTKGPFLGVAAPKKVVRYRIFDFYRMDSTGQKIQ